SFGGTTPGGESGRESGAGPPGKEPVRKKTGLRLVRMVLIFPGGRLTRAARRQPSLTTID
ncbi:MAG: hypothetical protein OES41_08975, partial [Rhodospirillales bacterium]|nr:hypothetical protein [Rhodospirillales bacterium]